MTNTELQGLMFPKENRVSPNKCMPDYNYIHKQLLRNEVSKNFCGQNTWRTVYTYIVVNVILTSKSVEQ